MQFITYFQFNENVSEGLGHSTVGITLDLYPHVLPNMQRHAVEAVANLLKRKPLAT